MSYIDEISVNDYMPFANALWEAYQFTTKEKTRYDLNSVLIEVNENRVVATNGKSIYVAKAKDIPRLKNSKFHDKYSLVLATNYPQPKAPKPKDTVEIIEDSIRPSIETLGTAFKVSDGQDFPLYRNVISRYTERAIKIDGKNLRKVIIDGDKKIRDVYKDLLFKSKGKEKVSIGRLEKRLLFCLDESYLKVIYLCQLDPELQKYNPGLYENIKYNEKFKIPKDIAEKYRAGNTIDEANPQMFPVSQSILAKGNNLSKDSIQTFIAISLYPKQLPIPLAMSINIAATFFWKSAFVIILPIKDLEIRNYNGEKVYISPRRAAACSGFQIDIKNQELPNNEPEKIDNTVLVTVQEEGGEVEAEELIQEIESRVPEEVLETPTQRKVSSIKFTGQIYRKLPAGLAESVQRLEKEKSIEVSGETISITPKGEEKAERIKAAEEITQEIKRGKQPYEWTIVKPGKQEGTSREVLGLIKAMSRGELAPSLSTIREWARGGYVSVVRKTIQPGKKSKRPASETLKYRRRYEYDMPAIVNFVTRQCTKSQLQRIYCRLKELKTKSKSKNIR